MFRSVFPPQLAAPEDKRGTHPTPAANAGGGGGGGSVTPESIGGGDHIRPITGLTDAGPDVRGRGLVYRSHQGGGGGAFRQDKPNLGGPWGETGEGESPNQPREPDRGSGRI